MEPVILEKEVIVKFLKTSLYYGLIIKSILKLILSKIIVSKTFKLFKSFASLNYILTRFNHFQQNVYGFNCISRSN